MYYYLAKINILISSNYIHNMVAPYLPVYETSICEAFQQMVYISQNLKKSYSILLKA